MSIDDGANWSLISDPTDRSLSIYHYPTLSYDGSKIITHIRSNYNLAVYERNTNTWSIVVPDDETYSWSKSVAGNKTLSWWLYAGYNLWEYKNGIFTEIPVEYFSPWIGYYNEIPRIEFDKGTDLYSFKRYYTTYVQGGKID
jgi:hypothetical protein